MCDALRIPALDRNDWAAAQPYVFLVQEADELEEARVGQMDPNYISAYMAEIVSRCVGETRLAAAMAFDVWYRQTFGQPRVPSFADELAAADAANSTNATDATDAVEEP